MPEVNVELTREVLETLNEAASTLEMTLEAMFEYAVRNALKLYHIIELDGWIRIIDDMGNIEKLKFRVTESWSQWIPRAITRLRRKPLPEEDSEFFRGYLDETVAQDAELQANVYGIHLAWLYNRLVVIGCIVAIRPGTTYTYSEAGIALGKIEFTPR